MSVKDIYNAAREEGLLPEDLRGKTPWQTMKSKLSVHIRRRGEQSTFVRTAAGRFYLRDLLDVSAVIYQAPAWAPPPSNELVTVFPSALLSKAHQFQGVRTVWENTFDHLFRSQQCVALPRPFAEMTEDYKQIVTYVLVKRNGLFLAFRRGAYNQTADMLRGADCIGFGGHVNQSDHTLFSSDDAGIADAALRELAEELKLPAEDVDRLRRGEGLTVVGLLNDDSSSVGRRHFAVILEYEVSSSELWDNPTRGEESITRLRWVGAPGVPLDLDDYEYWSQLCLRQYAPGLVKTAPSFKLRRGSAFRPPHLLCLVGEVGSGKTEAARTLVSYFGYSSVGTGRVLAGLLGVPPVPETPREVFQGLAEEFIRNATGPERLASAILQEAEVAGGQRVLVDGIRQLDTLECIRSEHGHRRVALLYVKTAPDIAYAFYRRRESSSASIEEFLRVRGAPVEREIPLMLRQADAVLFNWFGRGQFIEALRGILG
jgi:predicted NUDIX family phosphoesterase